MVHYAMKKNWTSLGAGTELIEKSGVSIDTATQATYEKIRLSGSWRVSQIYLSFIRSLKRSGEIKRTGINFVISPVNFRETPAFIRMGQDFEVDHCMFLLIQRCRDATTTDKYRELAMHNTSHPLNKEYREVPNDPICSLPSVMLPKYFPLPN